MALGRVLGDKFTSKFSFGLVFIGDSKNTSAHSECIPQTPQNDYTIDFVLTEILSNQ